MDSIQERIDGRRAKVYTAAEFKALVRGGARPPLDDVDVVTCGTCGIMSGTMAVLTIPVCGPGVFRHADSITLNGVPGNVGPCPNESLGLVDCIVHGTAKRDMGYGGGHMFRDLVAGKRIEVVAISEGREFRTSVTLSGIPFARMITTRSAFKNYTGFVNGSEEDVKTVFSGPEPLKGACSQASVSGCGEINPLQNDPDMIFMHQGASAMLNGAPAMIIGVGTRSSQSKPNLSLAADMHLMRADHMGGFRTSEGPECLVSVGVAIPVTDGRVLEDVSVLDGDIGIPLADVRDRIPVHADTYASVWRGNHAVAVDPSGCLHCRDCRADIGCPTDAEPSKGIDPDRCMSCGLCITTCTGGIFTSDLGHVRYGDRDVPIVLRQSSRGKADAVCVELKRRIDEGDWKLRCFDGGL